MIYLILGGVSAFFGLLSGVGATTLLRPLLDAVSPLAPASVAALCTMATLCAALVAAFFALNHALPLHPDELLLLAVGAALGGVLGLVISVGIILLAVLLDNKIHTEDDIAKYLDLAVVGVIPEYQGGKKK